MIVSYMAAFKCGFHTLILVVNGGDDVGERHLRITEACTHHGISCCRRVALHRGQHAAAGDGSTASRDRVEGWRALFTRVRTHSYNNTKHEYDIVWGSYRPIVSAPASVA